MTKLNTKKNNLYYQIKINDIKHNGKILWSTLNDIMGRKPNYSPSFIEGDGLFITKPFDIVNNFNDYFTTELFINEKNRILFNGSFSNIRYVQCGVPQGSCFGTLLFSIFTNYLPLVLHKARMSMYAADSALYMSAPKASELTVIIRYSTDYASRQIMQ